MQLRTLALTLLVACAHTSPPKQRTTVDMNFRDAPIQDVLRTLAESARVDISVAPDVTGTVNIDVKDAPWTEVLATITKEHSLRVIRTGNAMRIERSADSPASGALQPDGQER